MTLSPDRLLASAPQIEPIAVPGRDPVPLALLTGFLGAGKTTLLNRILQGDHGLRVGVLVNDFGAINIDAELIDGVEENTVSLTNGCVCCEIRDDLVDSLERLLTREEAVDYVLLEASGVADPEGVVMTFLDRKYEQLVRLDSITCVVDAEAIFTDGEDDRLSALKLRQIGFADMVVLNKTDLVRPDHVEVIRQWIGQYFQRIRIIEATRCDVPLEVLLAVGRFDPARAVAQHADASSEGRGRAQVTADEVFETWCYESDTPLSLDALCEMVRRQLPASVYRCKGIVYTADEPHRRLALQVVGRRAEVSDLGPWGDRRPRTQLVAIGSGIDGHELELRFDGCAP